MPAIKNSPVYPRWRGEHVTAIKIRQQCRGLSPLARGTLLPVPWWYSINRFIPAGAGNTRNQSVRQWQESVYPRWRGEHVTPSSPPLSTAGLSPLARGTLSAFCRIFANIRFIPAGAGNTIAPQHKITQRPVYPRWRGEHFGVIQRRRCVGGLSPLARGTRERAELPVAKIRFIPAGAGNTY